MTLTVFCALVATLSAGAAIVLEAGPWPRRLSLTLGALGLLLVLTETSTLEFRGFSSFATWLAGAATAFWLAFLLPVRRKPSILAAAFGLQSSLLILLRHLRWL